MSTKSENIGNLAEALSKAQGEFRGVTMNAVNPFFKSSYADLGAVIEAARPGLSKNGLSFSQLIGLDNGRIEVTTILMHQSGEWLETSIGLPVGEERGRSMAQSAGATITYLRRYALSAILGLASEEDNDGNEKEGAKQTHNPQNTPRNVPPKAPGSTQTNNMDENASAVENGAQSPEPAKMSYETAAAVTNREGLKYGEIDSATLSHMANALNTSIRKGGAQEEIDEKHLKLDAIKAILAYRSIHPQG